MQKFNLSDAFIDQYKSKKPDFGPMGEFIFLRTYSRIVEGENRNESWYETVRRVVEGCFSIQKDHCAKLRLPWKNTKAQRSAQIMFDKIFNFKFLPPGRGLWMMGTKFIEDRGSAALNNCFSGQTEFITNKGLKKFIDSVEEEVEVLNINGKYEKAKVKNFGIQKLFNFTFVPFSMRTNYSIEIEATENHRWILSDGKDTTNLSVGDKILLGGNKQSVNIDSIFYKTGFAHGLIFGDGTRHTYYPDRHFIKICDGRADDYVKIIKDVEGYKGIIYSKDNRPIITIIRPEENWKALPDITKNNVYLAGFIDGWIQADSWNKPSGSICLDTIYTEARDWLIKNAFYAGYIVTGISVSNNDTNFGKRTYPLNRITLTKHETEFICKSKEFIKEEEVFCVVAPETKTFTLAEGVLTGNCAFVSTEDIDTRGSFAFTWTMDALMLGVGVGFDAKGAGKITIKPAKSGDELLYKIPDTREGWVEATGMVIDAFFLGKKLPKFDYSLIRPYGAIIKGFGGVASGPEPLKTLHENLTIMLGMKIGEQLTSVDIVDIFNMIGVCVVAGNVRRSAEIAIGNYDDKLYTTMKDPEKHEAELKSHRWASNNSVFAQVGKTDYRKFMSSIAKNGEPGVVWLENIRKFGRTADPENYIDKFAAGVNPCSEQTLESYELCCLVETFPSRHSSFEEYKETLKYAYLYAKTVTLMPTHWEETNAVMMKNRRIGTSMSGIIDAFVKHGRRNMLDWADKGYKYLKELDETYSNWLCIPKSIKITSVKPSGTVSLLPGVSPGIHYPHSEFYIRRVRIASNSPLVEPLKKAGYNVEISVYGANQDEKNKTSIISFPVWEKNFIRKKEDATIWEQVKNAVDFQRFWADNNVSITVTFKENEKDQIASVLEAYEDTLKAISFLPLENHGYSQAPYTEITREEYLRYSSSLKEPDFSVVTTNAIGESYCSNDVCSLPEVVRKE